MIFVAEEKPLDILQIDENGRAPPSRPLEKSSAPIAPRPRSTAASALRAAAKGKDNLMPFIYDAVKCYATLGEICDALRATSSAPTKEVAIT